MQGSSPEYVEIIQQRSMYNGPGGLAVVGPPLLNAGDMVLIPIWKDPLEVRNGNHQQLLLRNLHNGQKELKKHNVEAFPGHKLPESAALSFPFSLSPLNNFHNSIYFNPPPKLFLKVRSLITSKESLVSRSDYLLCWALMANKQYSEHSST